MILRSCWPESHAHATLEPFSWAPQLPGSALNQSGSSTQWPEGAPLRFIRQHTSQHTPQSVGQIQNNPVVKSGESGNPHLRITSVRQTDRPATVCLTTAVICYSYFGIIFKSQRTVFGWPTRPSVRNTRCEPMLFWWQETSPSTLKTRGRWCSKNLTHSKAWGRRTGQKERLSQDCLRPSSSVRSILHGDRAKDFQAPNNVGNDHSLPPFYQNILCPMPEVMPDARNKHSKPLSAHRAVSLGDVC